MREFRSISSRRFELGETVIQVWLNDKTPGISYQHDVRRKMTALANRFEHPNELERRILNQLARELLLAQSSDWAFQIFKETTVQYSSSRFKSHIHRFNLLANMLVSSIFNEPLLAEIESRDNIFQEIDYRIYKTRTV